MHVVLNQLASLRSKAGVGHYTHELLAALRREFADDCWSAFPDGWTARVVEEAGRWIRLFPSRRATRSKSVQDHQIFSATQSSRSFRVNWLDAIHGRARTFVQDCLTHQLRIRTRREAFDLYHEPNYLPVDSDLPTVATFHDLSLLLYPQWHPPERVRHFERQLPGVLKRCRHFLVDCRSVREEAIRHLGLSRDRVSVATIGIRRHLRPLSKAETAEGVRRAGLPPRYLLYVGTIEPRKNLLGLLRAYCELPASFRTRWPLILVGGWGWNTTEVAEFFHTRGAPAGVRYLGYLPERCLAAVYNGARALLYPSYYEGFGLPPLEMLACGGAVICSTASALVENVGGQAHLLHPDDHTGWRAALIRVTTDDDWWRELRRGAVECARPFTWERCAHETREVYRKALGLQGTPSQDRRAG
jgi:alpha-1,3-rhamnosyl/mannosyltransferase